ncbi:hypothetical protein TorRG33x02_023880 [Trema orientale]|uniref:Transmembrane protein n=1 Tax=Trema orientale TaxID=63057 RepID=A0A2P5FUY7_TREOI|nr:hypothetical protein TorRG33x02_023880 [Trema orientale]
MGQTRPIRGRPRWRSALKVGSLGLTVILVVIVALGKPLICVIVIGRFGSGLEVEEVLGDDASGSGHGGCQESLPHLVDTGQ